MSIRSFKIRFYLLISQLIMCAELIIKIVGHVRCMLQCSQKLVFPKEEPILLEYSLSSPERQNNAWWHLWRLNWRLLYKKHIPIKWTNGLKLCYKSLLQLSWHACMVMPVGVSTLYVSGTVCMLNQLHQHGWVQLFLYEWG